MNLVIRQRQQGSVLKPIARLIQFTSPKCDGTYPGWEILLENGSEITHQDIAIQAKKLFPVELDGGKIHIDGSRIAVGVMATRYMDRPPGLNQFLAGPSDSARFHGNPSALAAERYQTGGVQHIHAVRLKTFSKNIRLFLNNQLEEITYVARR